jgi:hypothetical protein
MRHRHERHPAFWRAVVAALLVAGAAAAGQSSQTPAKPAQSPPVAESSVRAHMEFLASDALNGRGSGTRDEWLAATYIGSQFRAWGLEPMGDAGGFVQAIEMAASQAASPPTLTAGSTSLTHGREMLVWTLGGARISAPLQKYQTGAEVRAGSAVLLPQGGALTVAATAALILAPETDQQRQQWEKRGAAMPGLGMRPVKLNQTAPARPTLIYLDKPSYEALSRLNDGAAVSFDAPLKAGATSTTWNAVAKLTGSDPQASKEVIVLSAHLDHVGARPSTTPDVDTIFNGADDDASGVTAVLALAEALARGPRPRRTVVFALFGSEERGGFGAGYFVDLPVVPLAAIVADIQFEMIARPDSMLPARTLWLTGFERSNLGGELARHGARLVADPRPSENFFARSDNIRFARRGVVAHTVSSFGLHQDYHQPTDEIRLVDFAHMTEAIRSLVEPVRWLANSSFKPAWAPGGCPAPCGE